MLSMPFRDTVDQNPIDSTAVNRTSGQPSVMASVRFHPVQEKWRWMPRCGIRLQNASPNKMGDRA
jgi:hypothetical protein